MLNDMAVFFAYMWSNVAGFIVQNPLLAGLGLAAIVITAVFSVFGEKIIAHKMDKVLRNQADRRERDMEI